MAGAFVVAVEGLSALKDLENLPADVQLAAARAVNRATERGHASSRKEIMRQVNYPARYLSNSEGRLTIAKKANASSLEGVIRGRGRPTSLARFIRGSSKPYQAGVTVEVKPGHSTFMKRAFVFKLRSGSASIETAANLGLAIRLRPGETIRNKTSAVKRMKGNLYLLYGPSVDQVFGRKSGVAEQVSPDIADDLESEFLRQLDLLRR